MLTKEQIDAHMTLGIPFSDAQMQELRHELLKNGSTFECQVVLLFEKVIAHVRELESRVKAMEARDGGH